MSKIRKEMILLDEARAWVIFTTGVLVGRYTRLRFENLSATQCMKAYQTARDLIHVLLESSGSAPERTRDMLDLLGIAPARARFGRAKLRTFFQSAKAFMSCAKTA
jgi:hypothetical protein